MRAPDGVVAADPTGRRPGRGAYVCRTTDCIERAIARGALARALQAPLPPGLGDDLAAAITIQDMTIEGGTLGQE